MSASPIVHVYDAAPQRATRWFEDFDVRGKDGAVVTKRMWTRAPANRLYWAACCKRRRPAKNLTVKAFYDCIKFFCRKGKGCKP